MLVQYVLPTFALPAGHLRAKAAWVAGQFADVRFRERLGAGALLPRGAGATFQALFQSVLGLLRDVDLPVRLNGYKTCKWGLVHVLLLSLAAQEEQQQLRGKAGYVMVCSGSCKRGAVAQRRC